MQVTKELNPPSLRPSSRRWCHTMPLLFKVQLCALGSYLLSLFHHFSQPKHDGCPRFSILLSLWLPQNHLHALPLDPSSFPQRANRLTSREVCMPQDSTHSRYIFYRSSQNILLGKAQYSFLSKLNTVTWVLAPWDIISSG